MLSDVLRVFSAGTSRSTFVWQFGPSYLCVVLVEMLASFTYAAPLLFMLLCLISSGKFEREIKIVSMAPNRQYKGTRKMIDGQIGISANLTKLLFQLLQMIHHISIMRTQAEESPVNAFLHKIAELDRFIRP